MPGALADLVPGAPAVGGNDCARGSQLRPIADASAAARLEPAAISHALRYTCAGHPVMVGAQLMVVAQALGHADTGMVERHCGHLAPRHVRDVIRATALGIGAGEGGEGRNAPAGSIGPTNSRHWSGSGR
jgi:hypothetical protein